MRSARWPDALRPAPVAPESLRYGLRLASAVLLSFVVSALLHLPEGFWAVMSALIVVRPDTGSTLGAGWDRIRGALVGTALGLAGAGLRHVGGAHALAPLVLVTLLAFAAGLSPALRSAPISALIVVTSGGIAGHSAGQVALLRALEIGIGIAAAVLVSLVDSALARHDALSRRGGRAVACAGRCDRRPARSAGARSCRHRPSPRLAPARRAGRSGRPRGAPLRSPPAARRARAPSQERAVAGANRQRRGLVRTAAPARVLERRCRTCARDMAAEPDPRQRVGRRVAATRADRTSRCNPAALGCRPARRGARRVDATARRAARGGALRRRRTRRMAPARRRPRRPGTPRETGARAGRLGPLPRIEGSPPPVCQCPASSSSPPRCPTRTRRSTSAT